MNKKSLTLKIVSIVMIIVSIRGTTFVFTDTEFDYAGLPMFLIYIMLGGFVLVSIYIFWLAFIKKSK